MVGQRLHGQIAQIFWCQRQCFDHAAPRKQGRVDFEGGVLRGGAHQVNDSLFHKRQEGILLRLVEPVDFIDEK